MNEGSSRENAAADFGYGPLLSTPVGYASMARSDSHKDPVPMIHPTAVIDRNAHLAEHVAVGPYACIGPGVALGDGCRVGAHAILEGPTTVGENNRIGPHAIIGTPPQDLGYNDEPTRLEIGHGNIIREFVTIHRGTPKDRGVTTVGNHNMFMAYSHVGHDCRVGDHVIMANGATLAGHVTVENRVNIAGLCAIHQFARIGEYAMLGGGTMASMDIPPYAMASGNHARLYGLNRRALKRGGFHADAVHALRSAYRVLFKSALRLEDALAQIDQDGSLATAEVRHLVAFIRGTKRGITR